MKNLCALVILAILFISCDSKDPKELVGYWKGETLKQDISFSANGQVEIIDHQYSTYTGTYHITDGDVLTCQMDQAIFTQPIVKTVKINESKLILEEKTRKEVYHRR